MINILNIILRVILLLLAVPPGWPGKPATPKKPNFFNKVFDYVREQAKAVPKGQEVEHKAEQARRAAEYRTLKGKYLTPGQSWWLKFALWFLVFPFVMWLLFDFGWSNVFVIWVIGILSFIFGLKIALVFLVIYIITYTVFGSAIMAETGPYYDKAKIAVFTQINILKSQITGVGKWRNPYAPPVEEKKGIEIERVVGAKDSFFPGEDIEIMGYGVVKALERSATVRFGCSMGDKKGEIGKDKELLHVSPNVDDSFGIRCNLGEAPSVGEISYKKVKFSAIYNNFETDAKLRLYTLSKEKLDIFKNPFETFKIRDNLLDPKYKTTRSSYDYGPLKVSLYVADRQPLTQEESYTLMIGVDNDKLGWGGELAKFKYDSGIEEEWYAGLIARYYYKKAEEYKDMAGLLRLKFPNNIEYKKDKCKEIYILKPKEKQTFYCDFTIESVEDGLSFIEIEAEAIYDYEFIKESSVTITPKEA